MIRILVFCIAALSFLKSDQSIPWQENYKLSWENFIGQPDPNSDAAAVTSSGITFGYRLSRVNNVIESIHVEVTAHFYPEKSWVKSNEADNHILAHEQLHFDITELYTRKLRKATSQVVVSQNANNELDAIHSRIVKELNDYQNHYDDETNYSRNHEAQAKWQKSIKEALEALKDYQ
ncbi:DUF922 domain-containing protein [Hanstruepera marina]|uniref:DUF922 domain-containing protein n=1 Tax=Hanstruepera marina TaxID=2873265 RepID=UPI001CA6BF86|nr:hypothetical protein [Hanstruepera marina]